MGLCTLDEAESMTSAQLQVINSVAYKLQEEQANVFANKLAELLFGSKGRG